MVGEPTIDLEGLVYVDDWDPETSSTEQITLDALIARAVAPEMLLDEPQARQLLLRFRQRLLASLEHVNNSIQSLADQ
jgi:hypothetical protein